MRKALNTAIRMRGCEAGTTAVEFSIIGMVLIMFSFGLVEFGRGLYLYNKVSYAVDLAARKVLTKPDADDQMLKDEILAAFNPSEAPHVGVIIGPKTVDTTSAIESKTVTVNLPFEPLVPSMAIGTINLQVARRIPILP